MYIRSTKTNAGTEKLPMSEAVWRCFKAIPEERERSAVEKMIEGYSRFLSPDKEGVPLSAMHWEHRFHRMVGIHNAVCRVRIPKSTAYV